MITLYTAIIIGAVIMQAFFTATEMAFTSASKSKLKDLADSGDRHAVKLNKFLGKEGFYLGTTLVGTNIAVVISSVLATRILTEYFGSGLAPLLTTLILVPLTLIFAEIIPKMIARQFSTSIALNTVTLLSSFSNLFYPLIVSVNSIANILISPFVKQKDVSHSISKSDIKKILLSGHEVGEMEADEVDLIHKILDFGSKKVEGIMVPLYRVSSIEDCDTVDSLKRMVSFAGFSRYPVYKENKKNIEGIVNIYDVLFDSEENPKGSLVKDFLREPVYVNKGDGLDIGLARLRHQKQPMGIVVDDSNNAVGIVTIEDMLEEIVGEIEDTGANV